MEWQTLSEKDCCDALYQIGGALVTPTRPQD
jgi:hypothetical protein